MFDSNGRRMCQGEAMLYVDVHCYGCNKLCAYPSTTEIDGRRYCHMCATRPSEKSPEMEQFIDATTKKMFGRSRTESIRTLQCTTCGDKITEFRDQISYKEYTISGMCQVCQDKTFGGDDDR